MYSILYIYDELRGDKEQVPWDTVIWNRLSIPKHRSICWLDMQEKLETTERLARIGVSSSDQCLICTASVETHQHLFFQCKFT